MRFINIIVGVFTLLSTVSAADKPNCGPGIGKCNEGYCCSQYGFCGKTEDHCLLSKKCQPEYGNCTHKPTCGSTDGKCDDGYCCSKFGYCGKTDAHCLISEGCQSEFGKCNGVVIRKTKCGPKDGKCDEGYCCSKYGYCGKTEDHCSIGECQPEYGTCHGNPADNVEYAGFRFSAGKVKKVFNGKIPSPNEWVSMVKKFASNFKGAKPALIVIVSENSDIKKTRFQFKKPQGVSDSSNILYSDKDVFEDILTAFDKNNFNVWLQVEPGDNDLRNLAKITFNHYGHHSCVKGFGVDLEWWYRKCEKCDGKALNDSDAKNLVTYVRNFKSSYTVFAKHWKADFMPSTYRDHMIFINDSQQLKNKNNMISVFTTWTKKFTNIPVMFQIGYEADSSIWKGKEISTTKDLVKEVSKINSHIGILWIDGTMREVLNI